MSRIDVRTIRRDQILDAAERLVAHRGLARTTFADICRDAGISNGVLTYHFRDKDDLLLALYEWAAERWRARREPTLLSLEQPFEERLVALVHEATQRGEEERQLSLLLLHYLSQATDHPEIAARLRSLFDGVHARIAAAFIEDQARGDISVRDPVAAADVVRSVLLGLILGRASLGIDLPEEEVVAMLRCYLTGSAPRPDGGSPG